MPDAPTPRPFQASDIRVLASTIYRCEFNLPRDLKGGEATVDGETEIRHEIRFHPQRELTFVRLELHAGLVLGGAPAPVVLGAEFSYRVDHLAQYLQLSDDEEDQSAEVDDVFASILVGISLSTLRGMWSAIAKQTPFPDLHIRVYDPMEILNGPTLDD